SRILRATELIHENVSKDTISSKRDMFYRDVMAFGSQIAVNGIVEDLACTFEVPRSSLNVVAGTRSVVFGSVRMLEEDPLDSRFSQTSYNTLVPIPIRFSDIVEIEIHPRTRFVLVVEKEATLSNLISLGFCETNGPCILLTSKGFPDLVARQLLKALSEMVLDGIPLVALMDCDPYGIEIYLTYRCGSIKSAYENAKLAVPALKCLGQFPSDWDLFLESRPMLIPLTVKDRTKLERLITTHPYICQHARWRDQIAKMLEADAKTEIQSL
ncbi:DNA topoisomerase IV, alpha subunit, partial [Linnemannia elongata AG-77]